MDVPQPPWSDFKHMLKSPETDARAVWDLKELDRDLTERMENTQISRNLDGA